MLTNYLPKLASNVSMIAAARKINTKYVATRLAELSSRISDMIPRKGLVLEETFLPQIHGRNYTSLGI